VVSRSHTTTHQSR